MLSLFRKLPLGIAARASKSSTVIPNASALSVNARRAYVTATYIRAAPPAAKASAATATRQSNASGTKAKTSRSAGTQQKKASTSKSSAKKPKAKTAAGKKRTTKRKTAVKKKTPVRKTTRKRKAAVKPKPLSYRQTVQQLKDANALPPKRAPTAFSLFVKDNFKSQYEKQPTHLASTERLKQAMRTCAEEYRSLPESRKQAYHELYLKEKAAAQKAREDWEKTVDVALIAKLNRSINLRNKSKTGSKKLKIVLAKDENYVPKPLSSYILYMLDTRDDYSHLTSEPEKTKKIGERWQSLTAAEKEPYVQRANVLREEHKARTGS